MCSRWTFWAVFKVHEDVPFEYDNSSLLGNVSRIMAFKIFILLHSFVSFELSEYLISFPWFLYVSLSLKSILFLLKNLSLIFFTFVPYFPYFPYYIFCGVYSFLSTFSFGFHFRIFKSLLLCYVSSHFVSFCCLITVFPSSSSSDLCDSLKLQSFKKTLF